MEVKFFFGGEIQLRLKNSNFLFWSKNETFECKFISHKELIYCANKTYYKINDDFKITKIEVHEPSRSFTLFYLAEIDYFCYYHDCHLYLYKLEKINDKYYYIFNKMIKIDYLKSIVTTERYIVYERNCGTFEYYDPMCDATFKLPIKTCNRLCTLQNNIIGYHYNDELSFISLPDLKYLGSIKNIRDFFVVTSLNKTDFIAYHVLPCKKYSFTDKGIVAAASFSFTCTTFEFDYPWKYNEKLLKHIPVSSIVDLILVPYL